MCMKRDGTMFTTGVGRSWDSWDRDLLIWYSSSVWFHYHCQPATYCYFEKQSSLLSTSRSLSRLTRLKASQSRPRYISWPTIYHSTQWVIVCRGEQGTLLLLLHVCIPGLAGQLNPFFFILWGSRNIYYFLYFVDFLCCPFYVFNFFYWMCGYVGRPLISLPYHKQFCHD